MGPEREAGCPVKWLTRLGSFVLAVFAGLFVYLSNIAPYGPIPPLFALMFIVCLISSLFLLLLSKVFK